MAYIAPVPITHSTVAGNVPNESGESAPGALSLNITDRVLYTQTYGGAVVRIGAEQGGASLASAATVNASNLIETYADVTGAAAISAITLNAGQTITLRFTADDLVLFHNSNLVLPGAAAITTKAGDCATFRGYAGGITRCSSYSFAGSLALPAGTLAAPSMSARGDSNTGLYFPLADTIGLVTGGVERLRVNATGDVAIASAKKFYLDSGSDTYLVESAANTFDLVVGGNTAARFTATGTVIYSHVTLENVTSTGATGTGKLVFDGSPTLIAPALGTPSALVATNASGTAANLTAGNASKLGNALPSAYALAGHGHDYSGTYALAGHSHDYSSTYAPLSHSHAHTHTVVVDGVTYTTSSAL